MSATDNGRIDEIISALQFLGKEKLICYSEEIEWLTELKQRLANSEWRNAEYELPEEVNNIDRCSAVVLIGYFADGDNYRCIAVYSHMEKEWYSFDDWRLLQSPTHWMPLPEEPKNK